jgi:signal transduction histidine kinase
METGALHSTVDAEIRELLQKIGELNALKDKAAFVLIEQAFSLSQKTNDTLLKAEVLHAKAKYHCETNSNYDGSIALLEKAIETAGEGAPLAFSIKLNVAIGINYYYKGNLDIALKYYVRGIELAEKRALTDDGNPTGLASLYYNVATIFSGNEMFTLRKEYFSKALNIAKEHKHAFLEGRILNGLAGVMLEEKNFDEALTHLFAALNIAEQVKDTSGFAMITNNIGLAYVESGKYTEAIDYLLHGLAIKQQFDSKQTIAQSYSHLGLCYSKSNSHADAIRYFNLAIEILQEIGADRNLSECYASIAESYAALGKYDKAYSFQLQHDKLKDVLFSSNKAVTISETISSFEISRSGREAEALKSHSKKINELAERLERGNNELKQFTNLVAHDFKEPLRMIRGYIQLIKKHLNNNLTADEADLIKAAEAGVKQMDLLLHSLMELAKLNAKPVMTQVDLNEILLQVKMNLAEKISASNAIIIADTLPIVQADYIQMVQLFQNLFGNAIKYNQNSSPQVKISTQKFASHISITVADNGIGIDESYRQKVFELFQRLHSKYEFSGSGIGLSICKKIMDGLGGKIYIQDSELGGCAFVLELPC